MKNPVRVINLTSFELINGMYSFELLEESLYEYYSLTTHLCFGFYFQIEIVKTTLLQL